MCPTPARKRAREKERCATRLLDDALVLFSVQYLTTTLQLGQFSLALLQPTNQSISRLILPFHPPLALRSLALLLCAIFPFLPCWPLLLAETNHHLTSRAKQSIYSVRLTQMTQADRRRRQQELLQLLQPTSTVHANQH